MIKTQSINFQIKKDHKNDKKNPLISPLPKKNKIFRNIPYKNKIKSKKNILIYKEHSLNYSFRYDHLYENINGKLMTHSDHQEFLQE